MPPSRPVFNSPPKNQTSLLSLSSLSPVLHPPTLSATKIKATGVSAWGPPTGPHHPVRHDQRHPNPTQPKPRGDTRESSAQLSSATTTSARASAAAAAAEQEDMHVKSPRYYSIIPPLPSSRLSPHPGRSDHHHRAAGPTHPSRPPAASQASSCAFVPMRPQETPPPPPPKNLSHTLHSVFLFFFFPSLSLSLWSQ